MSGLATSRSASKRRRMTGRGKGHSFLRLPHYIITSDEWASLSAIAVKLLIDVAAQFRGSNNGDLQIAWRLMRPRGWNSQDTLNRAKRELLDAEWIVCTRHGGKHLCSLYAITWEPMDDVGKGVEIGPERVAPNAWRRQKSCSADRSNSSAIAPPVGAIQEPKPRDCSAGRSSRTKSEV